MVETGLSVTPDPGHRWAVLALEGEFDADAIPIFETTVSGCPVGVPLIADLTAVTFLGSLGIHALFRAAKSARLAALVRPSDSHLARVLDIVKAETVLPLFSTVGQAGAELGLTSSMTTHRRWRLSNLRALGAAAAARGGRN